MAELLLEAGADIISRGLNGCNPLHDAVVFGCVCPSFKGSLRYLINHVSGADQDIRPFQS